MDWFRWMAQTYIGFDTLTDTEKEEIENAITQASFSLFVKIWEEVSKLFLDYLKKINPVPIKIVSVILQENNIRKTNKIILYSSNAQSQWK